MTEKRALLEEIRRMSVDSMILGVCMDDRIEQLSDVHTIVAQRTMGDTCIGRRHSSLQPTERHSAVNSAVFEYFASQNNG